MEEEQLNISHLFNRQLNASEFGYIEVKTIVSLLLIFAVLFLFFFALRKYVIPYLSLRKSIKKGKILQFRIEVIVWGIFSLFALYQLLLDSLYITLIILLLIAISFMSFWMDFFAGIAFKLEHKFELNDPVRFENFEGVLDKVSTRNIQIKTDQQELVMIPFRKLSNAVFVKRQAKGKLHSAKIDLKLGEQQAEDVMKELSGWIYECPWAISGDQVNARKISDESISFTVYAADPESILKIESYLQIRLRKMTPPAGKM